MTRIRRWLRALLDRLIGPGCVPGQRELERRRGEGLYARCRCRTGGPAG